MPDNRTRFAAYPSGVVYSKPHTTATKNALQHLLWGDWLELTNQSEGPWHKVVARGTRGWMHEDEVQQHRLLEVNFVDIGQGDGCLVVTPDDKFIVIDAGEADNMFRFLRWRFGRFQKNVRFESFIITHPDKDHYYGFKKLFANKKVFIGTVFHNGIVERKDSRTLGPEKTFNGITYLDNVVQDMISLKTLLASEKQKSSRKLYPRLLRSAVENDRVGSIRMVSSRDGHIPGYGPNSELRLEVLSPAPEKCPDQHWRLRRFGDDSRTKNGHSIVIKLHYHNVTVLLGGDLNIPAENYLLHHYTTFDPERVTAAERMAMVTEARTVFEADVAKACHHGSADFTEDFLKSVNPIATIISSGDEESHSHPRPDALGSFGRYGRGTRPLIFSTELARSSKETITSPYRLRARIRELRREARGGETESIRKNAQNKLDKFTDAMINRSVAVYGMITLRTDGQRVVIAQKLERPRNNKSKWDIYRLEAPQGGRLSYVSKH